MTSDVSESVESDRANLARPSRLPRWLKSPKAQRVTGGIIVVMLLAGAGALTWGFFATSAERNDAVEAAVLQKQEAELKANSISRIEAKVVRCETNFTAIRGIIGPIQENLSALAQETQNMWHAGIGNTNYDRFDAAYRSMIPLSEQASAAYEKKCSDE